MLRRLQMRQILPVARPSDAADLAGQRRPLGRVGLVEVLFARQMACLLLGTAKVYLTDVAPEDLGLGLMGLALEVAVQLGLELKMKSTLLTIKLVPMRGLVMVLGLAVLGVLFGVATLVLTRLTIELLEFLLTFGFHRLTAKTCLTAVVLYAMLART